MQPHQLLPFFFFFEAREMPPKGTFHNMWLGSASAIPSECPTLPSSISQTSRAFREADKGKRMALSSFGGEMHPKLALRQIHRVPKAQRAFYIDELKMRFLFSHAASMEPPCSEAVFLNSERGGGRMPSCPVLWVCRKHPYCQPGNETAKSHLGLI